MGGAFADLIMAPDRIGRRPVIINGLMGVSVATLVFGLSKSLPQMLLGRALAGGLTGNVVSVPFSSAFTAAY